MLHVRFLVYPPAVKGEQAVVGTEKWPVQFLFSVKGWAARQAAIRWQQRVEALSRLQLDGVHSKRCAAGWLAP